MIKKIIYLTLGVVLALCISCSEEAKRNDVASKDSVSIQDDSLALEIRLKEAVLKKQVLTSKDIKNYADSLSIYFRKESGEKDYTCIYALDSTNIPGGKEYFYKISKKGLRNRLEDLRIYKFENHSLATDYFNDLKTQELVLPVGINKEFNDIVVNGTNVLWHNLGHGIGHRMKDFKKVFNSAVTTGALQSNADSVAGYNNNRNIRAQVDVSKLIGKWIITKSVKNYILDPWGENNGDSLVSYFGVEITKNNIELGEMVHGDECYSVTHFPDARYYFKYFLDQYYTGEDAEERRQKYYSKEYLTIVKRLAKPGQPVSVYTWYFGSNGSISFLQFDSKDMYAWYGNNFYCLKRMK